MSTTTETRCWKSKWIRIKTNYELDITDVDLLYDVDHLCNVNNFNDVHFVYDTSFVYYVYDVHFVCNVDNVTVKKIFFFQLNVMKCWNVCHFTNIVEFCFVLACLLTQWMNILQPIPFHFKTVIFVKKIFSLVNPT